MGEAEVAEFVAITGAPRGVALRLLDTAGGDLQEAIESFYADGGVTADAATEPAQPPSRKPSSGGGGGSRSKIAGFATLNHDEEDSEDDDHNEYYVGGEKSGQVVKGAPKNEGGDAVEGLFESARAAGAREGRPEDLHSHDHSGAGGSGSSGFRAFGGRARTLAGGEAAPSPTAEEDDDEEEEEGEKEKTVTIAFYANGIFTVNDGEPRRMDQPENLPFMAAISRGQCPPELAPEDPSIHISVNLVRRGEDYSPPAQPRFTAFAGSGRKLNAEPAAAAAPPPPPSVLSSGRGGGAVAWEGVDSDKPKTTIQLRLADGSRHIAEFNLDHTVGDIRRFIRAARTDMPLAYSLATAFPQAALNDDAVTIEAAGLANSVVIQKM